MIEIDGSQGEGGGQIVRSALTLSLMTGQPLRVINIRAGRKKPGLRAQHLKALEAAATISKASVQGASFSSNNFDFTPQNVQPGEYHFEIGIQRIIHPHEWADKHDPLRWITQQYTAALEQVVRTSPEQYLWIHRRWKHRPRGEKQSPDGIA